jgi:hypothetical protein
MSEGQGSISFSSAPSSGGIAVTGARNGLSVDADGYIILGTGAPANLIEDTTIYLGAYDLIFDPGIGLFSVGVPGTLEFDPVFNVTGLAQIDAIYINGSIPTLYTDYSGINTDYRRIDLGSGQYGDMIEDLTSVYVSAGFKGYAGAYYTAYVYGPTPQDPDPQAYVAGVSALPVYDNVGATALFNLIGFDSGMSSSVGSPVTDAWDFYARELNTVNRIGFTTTVTNHMAFYAENFVKATNNWGVYINGTMPSYFGGPVGVGNTAPNATAVLDLVSTTKGMLRPRMTTTQRLAIVTPAEGLMVYDLTLHEPYYYNGTAWAVG